MWARHNALWHGCEVYDGPTTDSSKTPTTTNRKNVFILLSAPKQEFNTKKKLFLVLRLLCRKIVTKPSSPECRISPISNNRVLYIFIHNFRDLHSINSLECSAKANNSKECCYYGMGKNRINLVQYYSYECVFCAHSYGPIKYMWLRCIQIPYLFGVGLFSLASCNAQRA